MIRLLQRAEVNELDPDSAERIRAHERVLESKPLLKGVFRDFHRLIRELDERYFGNVPGLRVEIGAGVAPVRSTYGDVLATDIVPAPNMDRVLDALDMKLPLASIRALYAVNCFHHFADPDRFFSEATRVLAPGGGIVLIEPYYGLLASIIYPRLFASEQYDKSMKGWKASTSGPMVGANQALSYIVFRRDRAEFLSRYPSLEIACERPISNYLRYILSGGLNFVQLVPSWAAPILKGVETLAVPLLPVMAIHHVIVLRKRA